MGHLTAIVVGIYSRYCFGHKSCFVAALYYSIQCIDYSTIQRLFIDMVILSLYNECYVDSEAAVDVHKLLYL